MLKPVRDILTYANVMATIAVFIALGGGAYGVTSALNGNEVVKACAKKKTGALRVVQRGKRCKRGERTISWNVSGLSGPKGSKGDTGSQGAPGVPGSPGTDGAAGAPGATGATGPTGPAPSTPANLSLLAENWGSFGNPTWTNQPVLLTELFGTTVGRVKADLTASTQVRLLCNVAQSGAATAAIRVQYSPDQTSWSYLDGSAGPSVSINTTGLKVSSWIDLAAGAKADVFLRVVGITGDGTADPGFGSIVLQVK